MDLSVNAPILIGNIPLRSEWSQIAPPLQAPGTMMPAMVPPPEAGAIPSVPTASYAPPTVEPSNYGANFNTDYGPTPAQPSAPTIFAPYPDMPPPSYSEAFGTGAAIKDDDDNSHIRTDEYKPLYPTYKWN